MFERLLAAYFRTVLSEQGGTAIVLVSIGACAVLVTWIWRTADLERRHLFVVAGLMTIVMFVVYSVAVATGAWTGAYFQTPPEVQAAILLPLLVAGWLAWLMAYRWLVAHTRQPLAAAVAVALVLVEAVALADRLNVGRGLVLLAPDGAVWVEALVGGVILVAPLALFEVIRRTLRREVLP